VLYCAGPSRWCLHTVCWLGSRRAGRIRVVQQRRQMLPPGVVWCSAAERADPPACCPDLPSCCGWVGVMFWPDAWQPRALVPVPAVQLSHAACEVAPASGITMHCAHAS
jgi:hypothetical protein